MEMEPHHWPRLFSREEANALLPALTPILLDLRSRKAALDDTRASLARLSPTLRGNGHGADVVALEMRLRELVDEISRGLRRIAAEGVAVKDLDAGLIDFPSLREGRVVFLCWHLGEGEIAWWHEIADGFAGRQPLEP